MDLSALQTIPAATTLEQLSASQIQELQAALQQLGYGLKPDGVLGSLTSGVWASFKADNGLTQPDAIGPSSVVLLQQRLQGGGADAIPPQAVDLVKTFEGFSATAYDDGTGVWTIGYGTTVYPDGSKVQRGQTATTAQSVTYLTHDMEATAATLASTIPYWSSMNPNQRSALISFAYNLGAGFYGSSGFNSISSALKAHRWSDVPSVMTLYSDPSDPNVHQGLLRRRIAEGELWQGKSQFTSST